MRNDSQALFLAHLLQCFQTENGTHNAAGERAMLNYLSTVCMCARGFTRFIYRNPGYPGLVISLCGRTLISSVRAHLLRTTCCLARFNDNVVTLTLDQGSRGLRESISRSI